MHKIGQSERFSGRPLGPLLKTGLSLMKNVLKPLAESVLTTLGLTAAVLARDAAIHEKMFGSGRPSDLALRTKTLITLIKKIIISWKRVSLLKNPFYWWSKRSKRSKRQFSQYAFRYIRC